jgi:hypothetical protein
VPPRAPIVCLEGPSAVGKTTPVAALAHAGDAGVRASRLRPMLPATLPCDRCTLRPCAMRVLERNGYGRAGVRRRAGFEDGTVIDRVVHARTRESPHPYVPAP